jgi:hypothetical protein
MKIPSAKRRGEIKRKLALSVRRGRPGICAFVNVFMAVSVAVGHYAVVLLYSFHIFDVWNPIEYV